MTATLFLTLEEHRLFSALSPSMRQHWKTATETGGAFESPQELEERFNDFSLGETTKEHLHLKVLISALESGKLDMHTLETLPTSFVLRFLHAIGARGISGLIEQMFSTARVTKSALEGIAFLSEVRHRFLLENALEQPVPIRHS